MAETPGFNVRIPADVLSAARARAEREHRPLADVIVRYLREYGDGEAAVAGVPLYARPELPGVLVAENAPEFTPEPRESGKPRCCDRPDILKGRCTRCHTFVGY